jgi:hypothetical protein
MALTNMVKAVRHFLIQGDHVVVAFCFFNSHAYNEALNILYYIVSSDKMISTE